MIKPGSWTAPGILSCHVSTVSGRLWHTELKLINLPLTVSRALSGPEAKVTKKVPPDPYSSPFQENGHLRLIPGVIVISAAREQVSLI